MKKFEALHAVAVPIQQSNVDTDQILPARYLQKPRSDNFGDYLFRDVRARRQGSNEMPFVLDQESYRNGTILVAKNNFGCGSSREHAVWALCDHGIRAVIAPSFGDIFFSNALKNGLLPIVLPAATVAALQDAIVARPGSQMKVDLEAQIVLAPDGTSHEFAIDSFAKHCMLNGLDEVDYTLSQMQAIVAFERSHDDEMPAPTGGQR
ncbi:MAG: 3-isopropylmalate dehydratase small subunit [Pseudolabrys sp.]|nr:3-isopropylmalate dehydratase small subunit [Pseudolabrys sp.]MDP2295054.1 3-isopropylmalate dehydratase small subunit [Pseudolabrys sp.]